MRRWKLSQNDVLSITKWEDYSRAKDTMFVHTNIPEAPWWEVDSDDKRRSRINAIAHLLSQIPYELVEREEIVIPPRPPSGGYERPPQDEDSQVPDYSAELERRHDEERVKSKKSKRSEGEGRRQDRREGAEEGRRERPASCRRASAHAHRQARDAAFELLELRHRRGEHLEAHGPRKSSAGAGRVR